MKATSETTTDLRADTRGAPTQSTVTPPPSGPRAPLKHRTARLRLKPRLIGAAPFVLALLFWLGLGPLPAGAVGVIFTECVDTTLELGQFLPIVRGFENESDSDLTIFVTMAANSIFGSEHVVLQQTLPKHTSITFSDAEGVNTTFATPLGTDHITLTVTSTKTGSTVLQTCEYNLTMILPAALRDLVQVPVRWCAVEGSAQAGGKRAGATVSGNKLLSVLQAVNDEIWVGAAHIVFRPAFAADGIPVIADPSPPSSSGGQLGDLDGGFLALDPKAAATACEAAWQQLYPDQRGMILVNARAFQDAGLTKGVTPAPSKALWVASRVPERGCVATICAGSLDG